MIDADALRLIASDPEMDELMRHRKGETACILTPHLAEFADLAHITLKEAAADRIAPMKKLCGRYNCTVIGKDARTLIASMLFGVRTGEDLGYRAAQAAAFIHAEAGDAARDSLGERSMTAGDLIRAERGAFRLLTK